MSTRRLRPRHIVPSGDYVWLVDEERPAAAVVDGVVPSLVLWSDPHVDGDAGDDHDARVVVADGIGIVVQDADRIVWVDRSGHVSSTSARGLSLVAADVGGAWLADQGTPAYDIPGVEPDEDDAGQESGRIGRVERDGSFRSTETARPVRDITVDGDELVVRFSEQPVAHASAWGHSIEYPTSTLRVARDAVMDHGLSGTPVREPSPSSDDSGWSEDEDMSTDLRWAWMETDPRLVLRHGVPAGGLLWWAGADQDGDAINRHALIRGHDHQTAEVVVDVDSGEGIVLAGAAVAGLLWLAIARQRFLAVPDSLGVEVLTVDAAGSTTTIHHPDSFDISATDPPLVAQPPDDAVRRHADEALAAFQGFDTFWKDSDGGSHPLTDGLSHVSAAVEGEWPTMRISVSLRHTSRPGLILRRTYPLFDERGRPVDLDHADIGIMEDLDTGYVPPAAEAVDGVLDF